MSQSSISSIRPFNNDHMPQFAQLQARVQAAQARQARQASQASLDGGSSAAVALHSAPPKPVQLDDAQAKSALQSVQQAADLSNVHAGLDPQRVARLLGLLD